MMTMELDMTAELIAIPYGLAIAVGISFVGILVGMSRRYVPNALAIVAAAYQHSHETMRRHLRGVSRLASTRGAH